MHGYTDYMLLLRPDEHISYQISNYKTLAAGIIGDFPSMRSAAHISVIHYTRKKPYIMRPAIDDLERKLSTMKAVRLQLNNFRFFVHKNDTYTIYAVIEPTYKTDGWFSILAKHMHINKNQFIPHITIARSINENSFLRLWPHFKYLVFRETCLINSLTVLERETLNSRAKWDIYRDIKFHALPQDNFTNEIY